MAFTRPSKTQRMFLLSTSAHVFRQFIVADAPFHLLFTQTLSSREKNDDTGDRELLAVNMALEEW